MKTTTRTASPATTSTECIEIPIEGETQYVSDRFEERTWIRGLPTTQRTTHKVVEHKVVGTTWMSTNGWYGIPTFTFRHGAIDVFRLLGFKVPLAKLSIVVLPDGVSPEGQPLVRIYGEPEIFNIFAGSVGILRARFPRWSCRVKVQYDTDQHTRADVVHVFARIGLMVGVGAGRIGRWGPGWGSFRIGDEVQVVAPGRKTA